MFANYLHRVIPSSPLIKFDFVEEKRHPDLALMGEVLEDIKKRTSGLIAERNRLMAEKARLEERVKALESELTTCKEEHAQLAAAPPTITPPVPSSNPAVGERIRALVEEIDACIALMPTPRDRAAVEFISA
jgi:hypothetical protein